MAKNTTETDQNVQKTSFSASWLERFDQYAISKTYSKGTLIFSEGDESDGMFLIHEGQVKVFMSDESGKEMLIALLGPGEIVGEVASLDGQPRTASVAAVVNTRVAKIGIGEFRQFIEENPDMALEIIHILTARIRDHATSISNLAFKNVYGRVVWLLEKTLGAKSRWNLYCEQAVYPAGYCRYGGLF